MGRWKLNKYGEWEEGFVVKGGRGGVVRLDKVRLG